MIQLAPPLGIQTGDARLTALSLWLESLSPSHGVIASSLRPASADASARRYFRIDGNRNDCSHDTMVVMDAPPATEDCRPFLHVAALMKKAGVNVPEVLASDVAQGFLLLTDLGHTTFLTALSDSNASELFGSAIDALIKWQLSSTDGALPPYDEALLRRELNLFPDWYVAQHLQRSLSASQAAALESVFAELVAASLAQQTVFVHRDFMPRNLMVSAPNPGVLDFQDAVIGPLTYDLVSLFRDAFVSWDDARVREWARMYFERAHRAKLPLPANFTYFWRDFEWMGMQRHLKVLGIFARIRYRDGKPHYLEDAPRFIRYVRAVALRYPELAPVLRLFDELEMH